MENFEYLLNGIKKEFGLEQEQLLHVAHGISSDQLTPEALEFDHVWVERGTDNGEGLLEGMKRLRTVKVTEPPARQGGGKVEDVDGLIGKLKELGAI